MAKAQNNPHDPLDEQAFLSNEFQRSRLMLQKYTDRQHELGLEKLRLEEEIMDRVQKGEDDSEQWKRLRAARHEIDSMAEGKLKIVQKIYNLSQRFVQELNESIVETTGLINDQKNSHNSRGQSYDQLQSMLSVPTMTPSIAMGGVDEEMDGGGKFDRHLDSKKRGQNRGLDGKFESQLKDLDDDYIEMEPMQEQYDGRSKQVNKRAEKKMKNEMFEIAVPRKRKARGTVSNAFFDSQQSTQPQPTLVHNDSFGGEMDVNFTGKTNGKVMSTNFGGKGLPKIESGDIDMLANPEGENQECCAACNSSNYMAPPTATPALEQNVLWLQCERCEKWYHAPCVGVDAANFDEDKEWYCCEAPAGNS